MSNSLTQVLTQADILAAASVRRNKAILPLPNGHDPNHVKTKRLIKSMLVDGTVEERPTASLVNVWRITADDTRYTLRLTKLGLSTAATSAEDLKTKVEPVIRATTSRKPLLAEPSKVALNAPKIEAAKPSAASASDLAPAGKLGKVLSAIRCESGASLADLIGLTGWQPHTIRASLTRLRQRGVPIQLAVHAGRKTYVAVPAPGDEVRP